MYISRLTIKNFRNFQSVDIPLVGNIVLLGENRVGKSNLLYAIRLVLDNTLPESARQLKLSDFWDGCVLSSNPEILIEIDFSDFDNDLNLVALLTEYRIPSNPSVARLSYSFKKKDDVATINSDNDCESSVYGGGDPLRNIQSQLRRRIALDMLDALRDAETQLTSWRNSPLRPLLEEAVGAVSNADLEKVTQNLEEANKVMAGFKSVNDLEESLRNGMRELSGEAQDIDARLRFAPADPLRLFRTIAMYIDNGKRGIAEASLGSANVALVALKLAEFEWRRIQNQRNYSLLCIEEPEAHLHPQLQRAVFNKLFKSGSINQGLIVTSHSPTLAAIAPLRQIVNLRAEHNQSQAYSLADLPVSPDELDDIERYLIATRSELLFAKAVIFVEGDAEETLLPGFAQALGFDLDKLGITVCNIAGVNFIPYVKLAASLGLHFSIITDWDPLDGTKPALGRTRSLSIYSAYSEIKKLPPFSHHDLTHWQNCDFNTFSAGWRPFGIFLNDQTFEIAVAKTPDLQPALLNILNEQGFGLTRTKRISSWMSGAEQINNEQLLAMIADIGKGRLSAKLAKKLTGLQPPEYISAAINHVVKYVQ